MLKSRVLYLFVIIVLLVGMIMGLILATFMVLNVFPVTKLYFLEQGKSLVFYYLAGAIALLCVVGAEYIGIILLKMMFSLSKDPFIEANVRALRGMGVTALAIMSLGLSTLLLHPVPLAVIAALPVGLCGLFSLVLSGVFERAVAYKKENDLTV